MIKLKKLVIVGSGEFAEIAYEYFTHDSPYEVIGFSVEKEYLDKLSLFNLPVVPFEEIENHFSPADCEVFVAITSTQLNRVRTRLYLAAKQKKYTVASYISSRAFVWHNATIGENCFIFENNVIQHWATIGNNVILWSGNHIGHRSTIEDNCFLSSHVVVSGYCHIGMNCFLGVNSTLVDNITVEKDCLVAAGALIIKNTLSGKIYKGNPAEASAVGTFRYFKISEINMLESPL
jgi:sugar O-acyltransferase (sialic acid O-acetyltransferase NeuD family)